MNTLIKWIIVFSTVSVSSYAQQILVLEHNSSL